MTAPIIPFAFEINDSGESTPCDYCTTYQAEVFIGNAISLCRSCTKRMRRTLADAEKALR